MIKLSNGVELSEDTVVSALKKAGINVEPKHIFEAGDIAYSGGIESFFSWRLIVSITGDLYSVDKNGIRCGSTQETFEDNKYKYAGRLQDSIKY